MLDGIFTRCREFDIILGALFFLAGAMTGKTFTPATCSQLLLYDPA